MTTPLEPTQKTAGPTLAQVEMISEIAYGTVRSFGQTQGSVDLSTWQILPDEEKTIYRQTVTRLLLTWDAPNPKVMHAIWAKQMLTDGWTDGTFDRFGRRHPDLLPWENLPPSKRMEWKLICAVANVFADGK